MIVLFVLAIFTADPSKTAAWDPQARPCFIARR